MEKKTPLISFLNISKQFNYQFILKDLNLNIYKGEILGLLGKSGCGKSTLLKILIGFYKPSIGNIYYKNKNLINNISEIRKIVGFVSQENSFYEKLTVEENIVFFSKLFYVSKKDLEDRLDFLLDLVDLKNSKDTLAENLSGGMKRRLEFAISLIHNPEILILDELFTGLDILIKQQLWEVVLKIKESGVTIIICSHLIDYIEKYCDRVVILNNKKIQAEIEIQEYKKNHLNFSLESFFIEEIKK